MEKFKSFMSSIYQLIKAVVQYLYGYFLRILLSLYDFIKEFIQGYWKKIAGLILLAVFGIVVVFITQSVPEYKIYVPGGIDEPFFTIFKRELREKVRKSNLKLDEVPIKIEFTKSDNFKNDLVKKHSQEIAQDPATLMVTGNFFSDQTKLALETYLNADPLIPVILITETTPNIIPSGEKLPPAIRNKDYYPILRLSPTDDNQARRAAEFALREIQKIEERAETPIPEQQEQEQIFWVLSDKSSPGYSEYLTRKFIAEIYESDYCQKNQAAKILLLPENFLPPSIDTLEKFNVHDIYFAGDWQNALVLIRELNAIKKNGRENTLNSIILSDSSATQNLLDHGRFDLVANEPPSSDNNQNERKIKIYVVSAFNAKHTPIDTVASEYYAERAFTVIKRIVEKTNENINNSRDIWSNPWWNVKTYFNIVSDILNKNIFKIHRASEARKHIIKTIENNIIVTQINLRQQEEIKNIEFFPTQIEGQFQNTESEIIKDFFFMLNPEIESRIGEMYIVPLEQSLFLAKPIQFYVWQIKSYAKKDKNGKTQKDKYGNIQYDYKFENAQLGEPDYRCRIFR